jgi:hypothetical protein
MRSEKMKAMIPDETPIGTRLRSRVPGRSKRYEDTHPHYGELIGWVEGFPIVKHGHLGEKKVATEYIVICSEKEYMPCNSSGFWWVEGGMEVKYE